MKTIYVSKVIVLLLLLPVWSEAQLVTISGKVVNSKNGQALKNVSIFESTLKIGTISDENGLFKLILSKGERNIQITEEGFNGILKNISMVNDTTLNVELEPEIRNRSKRKKHEKVHANTQQSKSTTLNKFVAF